MVRFSQTTEILTAVLFSFRSNTDYSQKFIRITPDSHLINKNPEDLTSNQKIKKQSSLPPFLSSIDELQDDANRSNTDRSNFNTARTLKPSIFRSFRTSKQRDISLNNKDSQPEIKQDNIVRRKSFNGFTLFRRTSNEGI